MKSLIILSVLALLGCSANKRLSDPIFLDVPKTKTEILHTSTDSDTLVIYSSGSSNCPTNQGGRVILFSKVGRSTKAIIYGNNNRIDTVDKTWNFPWRYIANHWDELKDDTTDYSFQDFSHYTYDELFIQLGSDTLNCYFEMADWHSNKSGAKVILHEKVQAMLYRN